MGLNKEITNNPSGRPQGSKNKKSKQWDLLAEMIVSKHAERLDSELDKLEGSEFIKAYTSLLAYFKPKLTVTKVDLQEEKEIKGINIIEIHTIDIKKEKQKRLIEVS